MDVLTGKGLLLASSVPEANVLLNILQCTGQLPTRKKYLAQNFSSVEVKKPFFKARPAIIVVFSTQCNIWYVASAQ